MTSDLPKNIPVICIVGNKLMPLDNTLPLLLELKRLGVASSITLIFARPGARALIEEQVFLNHAIRANGIRTVFTDRATGPLVLRLGDVLRRLAALRPMLYRRVLLIGHDVGRLAKALMKLNRSLFRGRQWQNVLAPWDTATLRHQTRVMMREYDRPPYTFRLADCDAALVSIDPDQLDGWTRLAGHTRTPLVNLGYGRGFRAWHDFIAANETVGVEGSVGGDYFFWPLTVMQRNERTGPQVDLREPMRHVLRLLKDMGEPLRIVFRYHPTTDREQVDHLLRETGTTNYAFSFAHPHQLIRRARFIFSQVGTSLLCDAHYLGCPVLQYVSHDWMFAEHDEAGRPISSLYGPVVDHFVTTEEGFRRAVTELATADIARKAPPALDPGELARRLAPHL